ncbi:MAG: proteasome accessory factor PafA2 family protein [Candidatus Methanomethyliaceae archaeon]|nr:proteasome accessory factor PafA2 family protein [Candidatus Methanomethyliaceae archaeon]MDW7970585.1 proteasome accessory factor PafA2 family protein [Nitrososphaerota archaeon]
MRLWQGIEVEYCVPYINGRTYVNELLEMLTKLKMPPNNEEALLAKKEGKYTQFLVNGGRAYGDMSSRLGVFDILEITTPECSNPFEALAYEKATEVYARMASDKYEEEKGLRVHCYKMSVTKSEQEYTTRGLHESYLVDRKNFENKINDIIPYLVIRQIFTGAGGYYFDRFLISPRQMFVKAVIAEKVFGNWPLLGGIDEPHADTKFRRLQITNGEGTRSEWTIFMRQSITSYVIKCIEQGFLKDVPRLKNPIESTKLIALSPEGDWSVELENGKEVSIFEIFSHYLEGIEKLFENMEINDHDRYALKELKFMLKKFEEGDFEALKERVEWITKLEVLEWNFSKYFEADDTKENKIIANNQYSAITDYTYERIQDELKLITLLSDEDLSKAVLFPPSNSRAYARVELAHILKDRLEDIGWAGFVIDGVRYPMLELDSWTREKIIDFLNKIIHK